MSDLAKVDDESWRDLLLKERIGKEIVHSPGSFRNAHLYLQHSERYGDLFAFDEFTCQTVLIDCPPWEDSSKFRVREIRDEDIVRLASCMETDGLRIGLDKLDKLVDAVARENAFHPARDYLNTLQWDGVERLKTWLQHYCRATKDDPEYLSGIGMIWFVGAATRILHPGAKLDGMLVLEGQPNAGKSLLLRRLATFNGEEYFTDGITLDKINEKDSMMILQGKLIVEFAELSGYNKREKEDIKRWITMQVDEFRLPFGRRSGKYPRQFVAAATHNPTGGWLTDPTGNRKFWPVLVGEKIDLEGIDRDKQQLWAEATHLAKQGFPLFLNEELFRKATIAQSDRMLQDAWHDDVMGIVYRKTFVTTLEIMKAIGLDISKRRGPESKIIAGILTMNDWEPSSRRGIRGWQKKNITEDEINEEIPW